MTRTRCKNDNRFIEVRRCGAEQIMLVAPRCAGIFRARHTLGTKHHHTRVCFAAQSKSKLLPVDTLLYDAK